MCAFYSIIMRTVGKASETAIQAIKAAGGIIRTGDARSKGIYDRTLVNLVNDGKLEQISRGLYRLVTKEPISNPDLVTVAAKIPQGVICLISALSFHNITTQIPHEVFVALDRNSRTPRLDYPPISVYRFTGKAFTEGVEKRKIDNIEVKIFNAEKTLADCFKFRNKIGMDIVLEALKLYKSKRKFDIHALLKYAKVCRIEKQMRPYLEVLV